VRKEQETQSAPRGLRELFQALKSAIPERA